MSKLLLNNLRKVSYFIFWGWLFAPALSISQIPSGYYNTAENKSDQSLRLALHNIIDDHIDYPYTSGLTDTWDILKIADADPNNANNVILIYTGESVNGPQEYDGWNREHVWAKSRGDFGTSRPTGTDVHNLRACNSNVNSTRSNYSFDNCSSSSCVQTYGNSYSSSALVFEPRDEDKGDVARIIFYMDLRYEGDSEEEDLEMTESILSNSSKLPRHGVRSTLLQWHELDPVDDFERNRNDVIYSYQGNRNPFIDHPELVDYIWGDQQQAAWNISLSNPTIQTDFELYISNPVQTSYADIPPNINASSIALYNLQGKQMSRLPGSAERIKMPTTSGIYFLQFVFDQSVVNKQIVVKAP
jgi:endonuclease I